MARALKPPLPVLAALKAVPAEPLNTPTVLLRGLPNASMPQLGELLKADVARCPKAFGCPNTPGPRLLGCPNEAPVPRPLIIAGLTPKPGIPPPNCEGAPKGLAPKVGMAFATPPEVQPLPKELVIAPQPNGEDGAALKGVAIGAAATEQGMGAAPKGVGTTAGSKALCSPPKMPAAQQLPRAFAREPPLAGNKKELADISQAEALAEA